MKIAKNIPMSNPERVLLPSITLAQTSSNYWYTNTKVQLKHDTRQSYANLYGHRGTDVTSLDLTTGIHASANLANRVNPV
jgi:hypothetical protein